MPFALENIKVIATDLDGTFFYPKKKIGLIPKKNIAFAQKFIDDGGRLVLVSSRSENFIPRIYRRLQRPFDFIGSGGCFCKIDGEMKWQTCFDPEELKSIIQYAKVNYHPWFFMLNSADKPLILAKSDVRPIIMTTYRAYMSLEGAYREPCVRSDHVFFSEIEKGKAYKLMLFVGFTKKQKLTAKKLTEDVNAKYQNIEAHWLNEIVEITPKGCTKAQGVAKYLDYLGLNSDNIMVVGDGGNDVPMFEQFHEHSYAMAHAHPSVKSHASKVIKRFADLEEELYPSADSESRK